MSTFKYYLPMTQTLSIKDARNSFADLISRVEMTGDEVVITKFGKPKAMVVPFKKSQSLSEILDESFGIWKDRADMKNTAKWVRNLRDKTSLRQR